MITRYENEIEGITFDLTPEEIEALKSIRIGGSGPKTPLSGLTEAELIAGFKSGRFKEPEVRAELKAKGYGDVAIDATIESAIEYAGPPTPGTPEAQKLVTSQQQAREQTKGPTSYADLSDAEIVANFDPQEAYRILVNEKGMTPASAAFKITQAEQKRAKEAEAEAGKKIDPLKTPQGQALAAKGLGPSLTVANIMEGAERGFWSPDDAYKALVTFKGLIEPEAATTLKMRGWQQGGQGQPQQAQQPQGAGMMTAAQGGPTPYNAPQMTGAPPAGMTQLQVPQTVYDTVVSAVQRGEDPQAAFGMATGGLTGKTALDRSLPYQGGLRVLR